MFDSEFDVKGICGIIFGLANPRFIIPQSKKSFQAKEVCLLRKLRLPKIFLIKQNFHQYLSNQLNIIEKIPNNILHKIVLKDEVENHAFNTRYLYHYGHINVF